MTIAVTERRARASGPGWTPRRRVAVFLVALVGWSVARAGLGDEIVNTGGWPNLWRFLTAVADPELSTEFLRLTLEAAGVTLAYAVLGTLLSLVLGVVFAPFVSRLLTPESGVRAGFRVAGVVPRAVHEILWALLFVQVLGFDPLVAVIAIGVPFGAVTAKVFAETIDEADPRPYRALRASGASRTGAFAYGVLPTVRGELVSYGFYRFECAIRSAAVLGVIGAGGLGFQLDLSFESLVYGEMWTLIAALMVLSGGADAWSSAVRRSTRPRVGTWTLAAVAVLVPLSWRWAGIDLATLWSDRTRRLAGDLLTDLFPPRLGPGGWNELLEASVDTIAMSVLALSIAGGGGLLLGALVARPAGRTAVVRPIGTLARGAGRLVLLWFRAVPAPVWAFLAVLVLYPGLWPGAVGLGVYNLGVLGRLYAEVFEEHDPGPADALVATGAGRTQAFLYATLPSVAPRLVSLTLYRWEVIVRETVVVGVVGAGGLGRLINEHLAARDFAAVTGAVAALVVVSLAIDTASAGLRRVLR